MILFYAVLPLLSRFIFMRSEKHLISHPRPHVNVFFLRPLLSPPPSGASADSTVSVPNVNEKIVPHSGYHPPAPPPTEPSREPPHSRERKTPCTGCSFQGTCFVM